MLQAETTLNFAVKMQYKAAITPTNMSGLAEKLGLRVGTRLKKISKMLHETVIEEVNLPNKHDVRW